MGSDGIPAITVEHSADDLSSLLTRHFNHSLKQSWSHEIGNYRPINNTSPIFKLFETITCDAINTHLLYNNLLSPVMRYMPTRLSKSRISVTWSWSFCCHCLLRYFEAIDKVNHHKLLADSLLMVWDPPLSWMHSVLNDHTQRAKMDDYSSKAECIHSGVIHGEFTWSALLYYLR